MALPAHVDLPPMSLVELRPGEHVFVQGHGVAVVRGQESRIGPQGPAEFMMFTLPHMTVGFPLDRICTSVRPLIDRARAEDVLERLRSGALVRDERTWEERYADCEAALLHADPERMAQAMLMLHARPEPRSNGERMMFMKLRDVLFGELAAVLGLTDEEIRATAAR